MKKNYTINYILSDTVPTTMVEMKYSKAHEGFYIKYYVYVEFKRAFQKCIEFPKKSRPIIGCKRLYGLKPYSSVYVDKLVD